MQEYVRKDVHTQGIENFWSLLKRGLNGTYVAVEPFHLDAYVTEQVFRYNNRATKDNPLTDADRFMLAVSQISGKRLTYAELTGKVGEATVLSWLGWGARSAGSGFRRSFRFLLCVQFRFDFCVRHRYKSPHKTCEVVGIAGYILSGIARPIRHTFSDLRQFSTTGKGEVCQKNCSNCGMTISAAVVQIQPNKLVTSRPL